MINLKQVRSTLVLGTAAMALTSAAGAAELGATGEPIKLAISEWTGQHVTTHIAGQLLTSMGYDVEYITAGNYPQFTALAEGDLSATLEVWSNNTGEVYPKMKEQGRVVDIGPLGLTTREGWMYPKHMEDLCPGLPDWEALKDCKDQLVTAETFPKGRILAYPADWGTRSADIIENMELDYKAVPAGSEGALVAELKSAQTRETPLVMMFWAPHWIFAEVDAGWVDLPAYEPACETDPSWGPNPDATGDCGVEAPEIFKVAWPGLKDKWPAAWDLLEAYKMETSDQEAMMKKIDDDGQPIEDVVAEWVEENSETWKPWVEAATK